MKRDIGETIWIIALRILLIAGYIVSLVTDNPEHLLYILGLLLATYLEDILDAIKKK